MKEEEPEISFKHWLSRTVMIAIILFMVVYGIQTYMKIEILFHTMIAVTLVLMLGLLHEGLHYYKALQTGYEIRWYRTKIRVGFEVHGTGPKNSQKKNFKKIGNFPYIFIIPLSIVILVVGYHYQNLGIMIAGIGSLLLHVISYTREGK